MDDDKGKLSLMPRLCWQFHVQIDYMVFWYCFPPLHLVHGKWAHIFLTVECILVTQVSEFYLIDAACLFFFMIQKKCVWISYPQIWYFYPCQVENSHSIANASLCCVAEFFSFFWTGKQGPVGELCSFYYRLLEIHKKLLEWCMVSTMRNENCCI